MDGITIKCEDFCYGIRAKCGEKGSNVGFDSIGLLAMILGSSKCNDYWGLEMVI